MFKKIILTALIISLAVIGHAHISESNTAPNPSIGSIVPDTTIYDTVTVVLEYIIACDSIINALRNNLIANFQFDGFIRDYSIYHNEATLSGGEFGTDRFGRENHALSLDGVDDYLTISHSEILNLDGFTDSYTVNFWIKALPHGNGRLLTKWNQIGSVGYPFSFQYASTGCLGAVHDGIHDNTTYNRFDGGDIWDGSWHLMTMVVDQGLDSTLLYLDGAFYSSVLLLAENPAQNTSDITLGSPNKGLFYSGLFDDLTIFNIALTNTDISELYTSHMCSQVLYDSTEIPPWIPVWDTMPLFDTIPVLDTIPFYDTISTSHEYIIACDSIINALRDNLIANFQFDGFIRDYSIYHNEAELVGGEYGTDRFSRDNHALYLDGVDDFMTIYHNDILNLDGFTDNYTLNIWVKSDDPNYGRLISKWNEIKGVPYPFSFQYSETGCSPTIGDGIKDNATYFRFSNSIWDNSWHLLTMVVDQVKDSMLLYLDGSFYHSVQLLAENPAQNDIDIYISSPILNLYYKGLIDDLTIFNIALTDTDISELFTSPMCTQVLFDSSLVPPWMPVWDTLTLLDTMTILDTITIIDTIPVMDTIPVIDTISVLDTITVTEYDTISITDTLIIDLSLDIHPVPSNAIIKVYPNPARDILHITILNYESINNYQLRIVNMSGSTVFETLLNQDSYTMDLSTITESGIYNLILTDDGHNKIAVRKIVFE